eukprot:6574495-Pyramimonas_sp.AAC.1
MAPQVHDDILDSCLGRLLKWVRVQDPDDNQDQTRPFSGRNARSGEVKQKCVSFTTQKYMFTKSGAGGSEAQKAFQMETDMAALRNHDQAQAQVRWSARHGHCGIDRRDVVMN